MKYKHKAWGYCSKCGFGSCRHLETDKIEKKFWREKLKGITKIFFK